MLQKRDIKILSCLRKDARERLTQICRKTKIPISTIHERIQYHRNHAIQKFSVLLDFTKFGYMAKAMILFKMTKKDKKRVRSYFIKHKSVNSVYRVNNGYDYMIEVVFRHIRDLEEFLEDLDEEFKIRSKEVHYMIDDLKREEFVPELDS